MEVKWTDRFNKEIVDSIANYRTYTVDTEIKEVREEIEKNGDEKISKKCRDFITASDFVEFSKTEKNSVVYTYSKAEEGEKSKPIQIEWSKWNDASEIAKVSGSRLFTIDTDYYQHRKELEDAGDEAGLTESNKKCRYFIAGSDFVDYAKKVVRLRIKQ